MLLGFVHNWPTSRWSATTKKKRKPVFIKRKWNHVVYSGATILSFHPVEGSHLSWDLYTTGQLVDGPQQKKKKRKPVFIKRKWNHVVYSGATILSFHPVEGSHLSWDLYTTGQLVDGLQQKKRKLVFIKRKWNHVVYSGATILSFHPVEGSYLSWDLYTTGQLVDGLQQKKKTGFH